MHYSWLKQVRLARGSLASPAGDTLVALARLEALVGNRFNAVAGAMGDGSHYQAVQQRLLRAAAASLPPASVLGPSFTGSARL